MYSLVCIVVILAKKISHYIWKITCKWLVIHLLLLQRQHLTKWFLLTSLGFTDFQSRSASIVLFDSFSSYSHSLYSSPPCPLPTHHPLEKHLGLQLSPLWGWHYFWLIPPLLCPRRHPGFPNWNPEPQHTRLHPLAILTHFWLGFSIQQSSSP